MSEGRAGTVHYLGTCKGNSLRELADEVDAGGITHMACVYRKNNGDLCYRLVGSEHLTYIIGMLTRTAAWMGGD